MFTTEVKDWQPLHCVFRPLQINSLFPVLFAGTFACRQAVHFHCSNIRLATFQTITHLIMAIADRLNIFGLNFHFLHCSNSTNLIAH